LDGNKSVNRTWTLKHDANQSFGASNLKFHFNNPADLDGGVTTALLKVGKYDSPNWTYPTVVDAQPTFTEVSGITDFSDFQLAQFQTYTLTPSADPGGTISPSAAVVVNKGSDSPKFT